MHSQKRAVLNPLLRSKKWESKNTLDACTGIPDCFQPPWFIVYFSKRGWKWTLENLRFTRRKTGNSLAKAQYSTLIVPLKKWKSKNTWDVYTGTRLFATPLIYHIFFETWGKMNLEELVIHSQKILAKARNLLRGGNTSEKAGKTPRKQRGELIRLWGATGERVCDCGGERHDLRRAIRDQTDTPSAALAVVAPALRRVTRQPAQRPVFKRNN